MPGTGRRQIRLTDLKKLIGISRIIPPKIVVPESWSKLITGGNHSPRKKRAFATWDDPPLSASEHQSDRCRVTPCSIDGPWWPRRFGWTWNLMEICSGIFSHETSSKRQLKSKENHVTHRRGVINNHRCHSSNPGLFWDVTRQLLSLSNWFLYPLGGPPPKERLIELIAFKPRNCQTHWWQSTLRWVPLGSRISSQAW